MNKKTQDELQQERIEELQDEGLSPDEIRDHLLLLVEAYE